MNIEVSNVKGFQDFMPPESLKLNQVKKIIEEKFQLHGFLPIETPLVEFDELMQPDILEGEDETAYYRFKLKDRAGRNLGLRYEMTFQLARLTKQNPNLKFPMRIYQIGNVFRDESLGVDRFRQITQCDADIIGEGSIKSEAECLCLAAEILKDLKIEAEIQVNNKKLLAALIESTEIKSTKEVIKELSKKNAIGEDQVKMNLKKYGDSNQIITLFKLLEKDLQFYKENAFEGVNELEELFIKCKKEGVQLKLNPFLTRNLSYYTGNIFEIVVPGRNSIAGGGRYDKLIGKYSGKQIPAVGISFGLERMTAVSNINIKKLKTVILSKREFVSQRLTKRLRELKIPCFTSAEDPEKVIQANSQSVEYFILLDEEEIKGKYKILDVSNNKYEFLTEKQLFKFLTE